MQWRAGINSASIRPPLFASKLKPTVNPYLQLVRMTSDQRFSNQIIEKFVCKLEVKLRDQGGKELQTIQFPSPDASQSVQLRQSMLAQKLWRIERIEQSGTLVPTRENKKMLPYWRDVDGQNMVLDEIAQHLTLGKDLDRPSDSAITLARSYGSYFATQQQAKSAEVVRHMRRTTWPIALMADLDALRSYLGDTKICSFGVVNADQ